MNCCLNLKLIYSYSFPEESLSVDSIKNALKLFQKWEMLECHTEKKLRLLYLRENQDNTDSVRTLYHRVNKFKTNNRNEL